MKKKYLGIGIIGGGFIARFHIRSWVGVRDADILGISIPTKSGPGKPRPGRVAQRREGQALQIDHGDDRRPGHRRPLDRRSELHPPRSHGRNRPCRAQGQGRAHRRRLREAPRPDRQGGAQDARAGQKGRSSRRVSRRTRFSRRPSRAAKISSGPGARPSPGLPTWPARPKSTADPTCPGSGRGRSRAAASSTT